MGVKVKGPMGYGAPEHPLAVRGTIPAGTVFEVDELEAERLVTERGFEVVEELGDQVDGDAPAVGDLEADVEEPGDSEGDSRSGSVAPDGPPAGPAVPPAPRGAAGGRAAGKAAGPKGKGKGRR